MAAPGGARRPLPPPLLLLLLGLAHSAGAFVVKDGNGSVCLRANFSADVQVRYDTSSGTKNATFSLPSDAEVLRTSSCSRGNSSGPSLALAVRDGCALILHFARDEASYRVERLLFTYNLSDAGSFPNASGSGAQTVEADPAIRANLDTRYRCSSRRHVRLNDSTDVTLSNVTLQAYLSGGDFSRGETRCEQDGPGPSPSPSPAPAPEPPAVGKYNVSGANGTCLLASVGLQLNVTFQQRDNKTVTRIFSIDPRKTTFSGSCAPQLATLELRGEGLGLLVLQFATNTSSSRFFLQEVRVNLTLPSARDPIFTAANGSLRALGAALGHSYRCSAEQRVRVTPDFSLGVVKAWLQAFQIQGDSFGAAEECPLDQNSMLIPIAVGGALAGLVLVVLIAYLIGRKRSHAGYQTI